MDEDGERALRQSRNSRCSGGSFQSVALLERILYLPLPVFPSRTQAQAAAESLVHAGRASAAVPLAALVRVHASRQKISRAQRCTWLSILASEPFPSGAARAGPACFLLFFFLAQRRWRLLFVAVIDCRQRLLWQLLHHLRPFCTAKGSCQIAAWLAEVRRTSRGRRGHSTIAAPMPSFKRREPGSKADRAASSASLAFPNPERLTHSPQSDVSASRPTASSASPSRSQQDNKERNRTPHAAHTAPLPSGVRPSPYPSPVPLFSTGLASLDDIITGHGLPASSLLVLCPALGLTSLEMLADDGATSGRARAGGSRARPNGETFGQAAALGTAASSSRLTVEALNAAEDTLLDLMSYSVAQGLLADHEVMVIGERARHLVSHRAPVRAVGRSEHSSKSAASWEAAQATAGQSSAESGPNGAASPLAAQAEEDSDAMRIAFRYAHRPKFKTTVDEPSVAPGSDFEIPDEHKFRAPFDMSKHLNADEIAKAESKHDGLLHIGETTRYDEAWRMIETQARRLETTAGVATWTSALRIHLMSLGSAAWGRPSESVQHRLIHLSRFLIRLRQLLRSLALDRQPPLYAVCTVTIAPELLSPPWMMVVTRHLMRLADAQLLLSDFAHDKHLARAYAGYSGSVSLLRGPSTGAVLAPGETRSVLRGGGGEAGAENDVGWRRRTRGRGIVLETLHEDIDAGSKAEDETTGVDQKRPGKYSAKRGDDIEEAALGLARKPQSSLPFANGAQHTHSHHNGATQPHHDHGVQGAGAPAASPPRTTPRFEGLKSLRERGLRATRPIDIKLEQDESPGRSDG